MHGRRLVVRADRAAPPARRRPEARRAIAHVGRDDRLRLRIARMQFRRRALPVELPSQHCAVTCDHRNAELAPVLRDHQVAHQRLGRGQETAGRRVGRVLEALVRAVDADQQFHLVVVRRDLFIGDRPIEAQSIARVRLEVVGSVAQRDAAPVIRASAQHARAPPFETSARVGARLHVRFARHLPAAVNGCVVEAEGLVRSGGFTQRGLIRCVKHRGLSERVVVAARFEHENARALHGERISRLSARGSRADDNDVVLPLRRSLCVDERHGQALSDSGAPRQPLPDPRLFFITVRSSRILDFTQAGRAVQRGRAAFPHARPSSA